MTPEQQKQVAEALRSARGALTEDHYGSGLSDEYVRRVDAEIRGALELLESQSAPERAPCGSQESAGHM